MTQWITTPCQGWDNPELILDKEREKCETKNKERCNNWMFQNGDIGDNGDLPRVPN